jgi:DNA-binding HxlR family transcriptional regulator
LNGRTRGSLGRGPSSGKRHFRELAESEEGIASNILADRLKKLEGWGLITRSTDPDSARQVVYDLTDKGLDLAPALIEIICWSAKYDPNTAAPRTTIDRMKKDKAGFAATLATAARKRRVKP